MLIGLQSVISKVVEDVDIRKPAFDLTLRFRGDLSLRVFCDQTNSEDDDSNYTFHTKDRIYIVGPRGRLRFETPSGGVPHW